MTIYIKTESLSMTIATCFLWRLSAYISVFTRLKRLVALGGSLILFGLSCYLYIINSFYFTISSGIFIFFFYLSEPFELEKYGSTNTKLISVCGIIFSGVLISYPPYLIVFMFLLFNGVTLNIIISRKFTSSGKEVIGKRWVMGKSSLQVYDFFAYATGFCHNAHYYIYSIILPVYFFRKNISPVLSGIIFAAGWIFYLFKDNITKFILRNSSQVILHALVVTGFLLTGILLYYFSIVSEIISILLWFLTGITAGIAESFWYFKRTQKYPQYLKFVWNCGGIFGVLVTFITYISFQSLYIVFNMAVIFCGLGMVFSGLQYLTHNPSSDV